MASNYHCNLKKTRAMLRLVVFQIVASSYVCAAFIVARPITLQKPYPQQQHDVCLFDSKESEKPKLYEDKVAGVRKITTSPFGNCKPKRKARFPRSAYPLALDEENLQHNWISFIDRSFLQSYSQTVRLVEPRNYARPDQFEKESANMYPTIDDVAEPKSLYGELATALRWNGILARILVGALAYLAFPVVISIVELLSKDVRREDLAVIAGAYMPGISIVLGTYFSLTISILYDRFAKLQEVINQEAAQLAVTCKNILLVFEKCPSSAVEGVQCVADQVRTLVYESRGKETIGVIYSDPYTRILDLLNSKKDEDLNLLVLEKLHMNVADLFQSRSKRLHYESLALAPTHFDVMTFLCGMLLAGFAIGTVSTDSYQGVPPLPAHLLFCFLVMCYTVFYEMAFDLNRPFDGIYQIRRSGSAMHFLQIKHMIATNPLVSGLVDFEEVEPMDDREFELMCDEDCQRIKKETWFN